VELEIEGEARLGTRKYLALSYRVNDFEAADPGNGAAEADQGIAVQLVCPAEVMDDFGDGFSGDVVPFVMSELVIGGGGTALV